MLAEILGDVLRAPAWAGALMFLPAVPEVLFEDVVEGGARILEQVVVEDNVSMRHRSLESGIYWLWRLSLVGRDRVNDGALGECAFPSHFCPGILHQAAPMSIQKGDRDIVWLEMPPGRLRETS